MYIHNISPIIFSIGPFAVRWYGLVYVFGFLLAYYVLYKQSKQGKIALTEKEIEALILYIIFGVILGARLFEVLVWESSYYLANPADIIAVWKGGMSFHGGLIGILIAGWLFTKRYKKISLAKLADILTIPALIALVLGRIANFINAELVGTVTNARWCVVFPKTDSLCRHPVQLYAALKRLIILGVLVFINRKEHKDGFLFWSFAALIGIGRFIVDFWKEEVMYFGFSTGQYLGLLTFAIGLYVLIRYYKDDLTKTFK